MGYRLSSGIREVEGGGRQELGGQGTELPVSFPSPHPLTPGSARHRALSAKSSSDRLVPEGRRKLNWVRIPASLSEALCWGLENEGGSGSWKASDGRKRMFALQREWLEGRQ